MSKRYKSKVEASDKKPATLLEPKENARIYIPTQLYEQLFPDAIKQAPATLRAWLEPTKKAGEYLKYAFQIDVNDKGRTGHSVLLHTYYYGVTDSTGTVNVGSSAIQQAQVITQTPVIAQAQANLEAKVNDLTTKFDTLVALLTKGK